MADSSDSQAEMSEEELAERLSQLVGSTPMPEEKQNLHTFLTKVVTTPDTTKLGYLKEEEIGLPVLPIRTFKDLELFCNEVANMDYFGEYFKKKGEILTSTSLSRDAKLLSLAVMQRKELIAKDASFPKKENKGWFKKREDNKTDLS